MVTKNGKCQERGCMGQMWPLSWKDLRQPVVEELGEQGPRRGLPPDGSAAGKQHGCVPGLRKTSNGHAGQRGQGLARKQDPRVWQRRFAARAIRFSPQG